MLPRALEDTPALAVGRGSEGAGGSDSDHSLATLGDRLEARGLAASPSHELSSGSGHRHDGDFGTA